MEKKSFSHVCYFLPTLYRIFRDFTAGRIKAGCDLISQYLPTNIYTALLATYEFVNWTLFVYIFANYHEHHSFTKLDAYLQTLQDENIPVAANTAKTKVKDTDNVDDKKRKLKSKASQGVDKLKKANISGMAKMSSFFKKAS